MVKLNMIAIHHDIPQFTVGYLYDISLFYINT